MLQQNKENVKNSWVMKVLRQHKFIPKLSLNRKQK